MAGQRFEVIPESRWVRRLWRSAQAAIGGVGVTLGALLATGMPEWGLVTAGLGALSGLLFSLSLQSRRRRSTEAPETLDVDPTGITLRGERLPRERIVDGGVEPRTIQSLLQAVLHRTPLGRWLRVPPNDGVVHDVTLTERGRFAWPLRFTVEDAAQAWVLLDALGLGADRRAVVRRVMSPLLGPRYAIPSALAVWGAIALGALGGPVLGFVPLAAVLGFVLLAYRRTRVTIGADGVSVRWIGPPRVVPLTDIAGVEVVPRTMFTPATVRVLRHGGPPLELPIGVGRNGPFGPHHVDDEAALIATRIREVVAKGTATEPVEFRAWLGPRVSLDKDTCLRALRGAAEAYRDSGEIPFTRAELWAVLENVRASALERVAALVALAVAPGTEGRARAAELAKATAVPALAEALDAVAAGDEAALTKVLARLQDAELAALRAARPRAGARMRVEAPSEESEEIPDEDEASPLAGRRAVRHER